MTNPEGFLCHLRSYTDSGIFYLGSSFGYFRKRHYGRLTSALIYGLEGNVVGEVTYKLVGYQLGGPRFGDYGPTLTLQTYAGSNRGLVNVDPLSPLLHHYEIISGSDLLTFEGGPEPTGLFWIIPYEVPQSNFVAGTFRAQMNSLHLSLSPNVTILKNIGEMEVNLGQRKSGALQYSDWIYEEKLREGIFIPFSLRDKPGSGIAYLKQIISDSIAVWEYFSSSAMCLEKNDILIGSAHLPDNSYHNNIPADSTVRVCEINMGYVLEIT